ncbi:sensor histidine kinase [Streptomyces sp. NPDC020983]|uniref:sensor histidine kinase n=1 Tax=Streptomyces sp. NPDC020983 TaxID=3365106 RepID=UPI0037886775
MLFAADPDGGPSPGPGSPPAGATACQVRAITSTVLACWLLIFLVTVCAGQPTGPEVAAAALSALGVFGTQQLHSSPRAARWGLCRKVLSLTAQCLCVLIPLFVSGHAWNPDSGFLAGSCLLLFSGPVAWALSALPAALVLLTAVHARTPWPTTAVHTLTTVLTGIAVYALARLARLAAPEGGAHGDAAQREAARKAVTEERLRIASDLHDLLGYSLSAIALKCELAGRLVTRHPDRALTEIGSVLDITRQAITDVRTIAQGYRDLSLAEETAAAQALLTAADIKTTVCNECGPLPQAQDTVLASALREGVTNMLRHGDVRACEISAVDNGRTVRLELVNDGLRLPTVVPARRGTGLESIERRVSSVGGTVTTRIAEDGRFHLVVSVLRNTAGQRRSA